MYALSFRPIRSNALLCSLLIASLLTFSILMAPHTSAAASDVVWDIKTIDGSGGYTSIDVGPNGSVHISYCDSNSNDLKYTCMAADGSSWTMETVDNGTTAYSSIAVAADGSVHISYFDDSNGDLKYATRASNETSWTIETVDSEGNVGSYSSIAISSNASVYISYCDVSNWDLKYATRASNETSWTIETVDSEGEVGSYPSIAIADNGSVHISYFDSNAAKLDLKYATRASNETSWTIEVADSSGSVGKLSSIAVDADGKVHISYHDYSNRDVKYASKPAGGSWSTEKVGDTSTGYTDVGHSSLAVDAYGTVHISYASVGVGSNWYYHLSYAVKEVGGSWTTVRADTTNICGKDNSIALGSGNVYISYSQSTEPFSVKCAIGELPWAPSFMNNPSYGLVTNEYEHTPLFDEEVEITDHDTDAPFLTWNGTAFVGTPGVDDVGYYYITITAKSVEGRLSATQNTSISIAPMPTSLRINDDWEMDMAVRWYGMEGDGSAEHPYIITGLNIDSHGAYENSLFIGNVTYHFQVIGNHLGNTSGTYTWDGGEVAALYLFNCGNATVSSNYLNDTLTGIRAYACPGAVIDGNVISGDATDGIFISEGCDNAVISGNEVDGSADTSGVSVYSSRDIMIADNEFDCGYGVYIESSDGNIIEGNNCSGCSQACIWLVLTGNSTVSNNDCSDATYGIRLSESANNTVSDNICCGNGYTGIYLDISRDNHILNNNCSDTVNGIWLTESANNTVSGNICCHNANDGIYLDYAADNVVSGNDCSWNGLNGIILIESEGNIIADNECNDNDNNEDGSISGSGIRLIQSEGNLLENNTCCSNSDGIDVWSSNDNMLVNNTCCGNIATIYDQYGGMGIFINASEGCSVVDSICNDNSLRGIYIQNGNWSSIEGCFIEGNVLGIYLDLSDNCTLTANTFDTNSGGICLTGCRNGTISFNLVMNSLVQGLYIVQNIGGVLSENNTVFGNHFIANNGATSSYNSSHVQAYGSGNNSWNQGAIGNIWSDWMSPDDDADGIVDHAYMIEGGDDSDPCPQAFSLNVTAPSTSMRTNATSVSISGTASSYSGIASLTWHNSANGMSGVVAISGTWTVSVPLASGTNVITVNMTGDDGANLSDSVSVFCDPEPPVIVIVSPVNGSYYTTGSVNVTWTGSDVLLEIDHYAYSTDGTMWTNTTALNHTFTLADGEHMVFVRAYDTVGNMNETNVTFTVDTVAPVLTITFPVDGSYVNTDSINVTWTGSDANGIDHYVYSTDGTVWTNTYAINNTFVFADGEHMVFVRAYDKAGNMNETNVTFTVDVVAPELEITSPDNGAYNNTGSGTITWTVDDANLATVFLRFSNGTWTNVTGLSSYTNSSLIDGPLTIYLNATDLAGNYNLTSVTVTIDTVAPSVFLTYPNAGSFNNTGSVNVTWTGSDANGIDHFAYSTDGSTWTSTIALDHTFALADGEHTVYVRTYDVAGNYNETNVTFTVDTTAPVLVITYPTAGSHISTGDVTVTWTADDDRAIAHFLVRVDGGDWTYVGLGNLSRAIEGLSEGGHTVAVEVIDLAGNHFTDAVSFTVDTVAPVLTITFPVDGSYVNTGSINVTWNGSDVNGIDHYAYSTDGTTWTNTTTTNHTFDLADGEHTVFVRAYDAAGNLDEGNVTVMVDTEAPTIVVSSPSGADVPINATIVVRFSEAMNISATQITVRDVSGTVVWNGSIAVLTPSSLAYNQAYTVNVTGQDLAGNVISIGWTFSTPEVGDITGLLLDKGGNALANATVRLSNGMTVVTDADGTFLFEDVPTGNYELTVDGEGYEDMAFNVTVDTAETADLGEIEAEAGSDPTLIIVVVLVLVVALAGGAFLFVRMKRRK